MNTTFALITVLCRGSAAVSCCVGAAIRSRWQVVYATQRTTLSRWQLSYASLCKSREKELYMKGMPLNK